MDLRKHPVHIFVTAAAHTPALSPAEFLDARNLIVETAAILINADTPAELAQALLAMYDGEHTLEDICVDLRIAIGEALVELTLDAYKAATTAPAGAVQ